MDKVNVEISLVLIGHLLRKLFTYYDGKSKFFYWVGPEDLEDEVMPEINPKTFKKIKKKTLMKQQEEITKTKNRFLNSLSFS